MSGSDLDLRVAWQQHLGVTPTSMRWFESVLSRHREPHRHYHDVRHVRWVVRHVIELGHDLDLAPVVAAAFFHDAIYEPTEHTNESASGRLAAAALTELGWPAMQVELVDRLIVGTAQHTVTDVSRAEAVLFAADLGVLAAEPAAYGDYVRNVRREYAHVDDEAWVIGRTAVLDSFLTRPAIYAPTLGLEAWEMRARANLTAERTTLARPNG